MLAEVQSLVAPTTNPNPRRGVSGLDSSRVAMLVAITERVAGLKLADKDVFVATVGGIRLVDPSTDLATCLAIGSAANDAPLPLDIAAIGEVTLSGDVRRVPMVGQRIAEAVRLGYARVLAPIGATAALESRISDVEIIEVRDLAQAFALLSGMREPDPTF
jgi:DNA repair protein RadA/Sms